MIFRRLLPATLAASAFLPGQNQTRLTPRELFYVPAAAAQAQKKTPKNSEPRIQTPTPEPPAQHQYDVEIVSAAYSGPRPLGLRYSILKRNEDRTFDEVNTDSIFRSGDKIRLRVESNEDGHLYIVMRGASGNWRVLFPSPEIKSGDNHVEAGQPQMIPSGNGVFSFDEKKGEEKLFLVLARNEVPDLEKLIYDLNEASRPAPVEAKAPAATKKTAAPVKPRTEAPQEKKAAEPKRMMLAQSISPIDDALVGKLRGEMLSRDLVFEKVSDSAPGPQKESAVYVVEKSGRKDARLVADIKLKHE
ncbi:MAG: DUF4384 domain-containing protein [Acidobacteria bacterium]|nr:DUF4384 domain-containing protein [Acidobacteriota bacterium]